MIRRLLTRWAARWLSAAAHKGRLTDKQRIKNRTRQLRAELGLPDHPALTTTKGN